MTSLGKSGVFFMSGIFSVIGAVFTLVFIPRTKDKSMYELEILFSKTQKSSEPSNDSKAVDLFDSKAILKAEQNL